MAKSGNKTDRGGDDLANSPSHLLHRALQRAVGLYGEEMAGATVTQRQYALLTAVAGADQPSQTELVDETGIDRSTLAELVARLIEKGLLSRARSDSDGRVKTVALTDAGSAVLEAAQPRVRAADKRILSLLPKGKRETFLKLLTRLADEPEPKKKAKGKKASKKAASAG